MITRRDFVRSGGLVLIGLKTGLLVGCRRDRPPALDTPLADADLEAALRSLAGEFSGIDFVGPQCLIGIEPDRLAPDLVEALRDTGADVLGGAIQAATRADFAEGRIRDLADWQLSETECALAALAAMVQGLDTPVLAESGAMTELEFVEVERWGPRETYQHRVFNPQPNGGGGFWVQFVGDAPGSTRLAVNGEELQTHVGAQVITAGLDADEIQALIAEPGRYSITLVDKARGRIQTLGHFKVHPEAESAVLQDGSVSEVFCEVERWGPKYTDRGDAFNEQPDGSSGFWVRIGCAPGNARLELAGRRLPTTVRTGLVTARVDFYADLEPGTHELRLIDPDSGERLMVGEFAVR